MELRSALGIALGSFAAIAAAGVAYGSFDVDQVHVVLMLVIIVVASAALGGRSAGVVVAVVAALSFDYFHTAPYRSLEVESTKDIVTMLLLVVVGVVVGALSSWGSVGSERAHDDEVEIHRLGRVSALVASNTDSDGLIDAVARELCASLGLDRAEFTLGPVPSDAPSLAAGGGLDTRRVEHGLHGFVLEPGTLLAVRDGGRILGYFVLSPHDRSGVSLDHRIVASTMADLLGAALGQRGLLV